MNNRITVISSDAMLVKKIENSDNTTGLSVVHLLPDAPVNTGNAPAAVVVELELEDAIELVASFKRKWPQTLVAVSVAIPDQERWLAAKAAGAHLVINKGAIADVLTEKLSRLGTDGYIIAPRKRLLVKAVHNPGDGLVGRVPDAPDGEVAVFRLSDKLYAIRDVCPHAGFTLSDGEFDAQNGILTCPQHGSQFNVCNGERTRGPADFPIACYPVIEESGELYIEI